MNAKTEKHRRALPALAAAFWLVLSLFFPLTAAAQGDLSLEDGEYTVEVSLSGGSGRATVASPAALTVTGGSAVVRIEWSSPNYDYMKLGGEQYFPVNEDGNSVFELPVPAFDTPVEVTADTTAMSVPHEIEYTLCFDSSSVSKAGGHTALWAGAAAALILILLVCLALKFKRKGASK